MYIFLIYAIVLGFFWIKTLSSTVDGNTDSEIKIALQLKYSKIRHYKQYGLLYIITLFYLVSISMVSANYIPKNLSGEKGLTHAISLISSFPFWLQGLFIIALLLFIFMFIWPLINAIKHTKMKNQHD